MKDEEYKSSISKPVKKASQPKQLLKDQHVAFGGLPLNDQTKIPIIKYVEAKKKEVKTFSLNEYLDNYL